MHNMNTIRYVIDTNILINFKIFTPMEIHVKFWRQLSHSIEQGHIILLADVARECKSEPLKSWVRNQKITPTDDVKSEAIKINNKYKLITEKDGIKKSEADPVIIAYAQKRKYTVFSYESERKNSKKPYKIPDVCTALGVPFEKRTNKVLKEIDFKKIY